MPKYIDADALKERFEDFAIYSYCEIEYKIDDTAAADVQAVKYGKWEMNHEMMTCTNCAESFDKIFKYDYLYCPRCGARMDGDEK